MICVLCLLCVQWSLFYCPLTVWCIMLCVASHAARQVTGEVDLKDVRFRYPSRPETEVLRGLNLSLFPGKVVALVGPSGGGKSTVCHLIEVQTRRHRHRHTHIHTRTHTPHTCTYSDTDALAHNVSLSLLSGLGILLS